MGKLDKLIIKGINCFKYLKHKFPNLLTYMLNVLYNCSTYDSCTSHCMTQESLPFLLMQHDSSSDHIRSFVTYPFVFR